MRILLARPRIIMRHIVEFIGGTMKTSTIVRSFSG
jgi:hypothetical protein